MAAWPAGKSPDSADKKAPGMLRADTQQAEGWAVRRVNDVVADDLKWFFRAEPLFDYGVDAQAEVVADDALVTGRLPGLISDRPLDPGRNSFRW
jgi:hypothetical protein